MFASLATSNQPLAAQSLVYHVNGIERDLIANSIRLADMRGNDKETIRDRLLIVEKPLE